MLHGSIPYKKRLTKKEEHDIIYIRKDERRYRMENLIKSYQEIRKKLKAYDYARYIISWDSSTEAPKGCLEDRGKYVGILSELSYQLSTSPEYINIVNSLMNIKEELDPVLKHEIEVVKREIDRNLKVPMNEYVEFQVLMASSQEIWAQAKINNDFNSFKPTLKKIVTFFRKYIKYQETETEKGYNILLDMYEPKMTMAEYDQFFALLKAQLIPFLKKIQAKEIKFRDDFNLLTYEKAKQKAFCEYLMDALVFDRNRGLMKESEHPFTSGFGTSDVRVTNHYYENEFTSAIFSAIHELGHGLYEQQVDPSLDDTYCSGGASMALHESQSRLYENMIGRSHEFWEAHYPKLQETFKEQLKDVSLDEFYHFINIVKPSYIRTDADELTYPIHIMLRYDIEKALFNNEIEVDDLENVWNDLFYQYFGIKVDQAKNGVLQDVHWSGGMFGYFPTYALGSAYAAQFYHYMEKDLNVKEILKSGSTKPLNDWMKEKIHKYGASLYPNEIIKLAVGEAFNPKYYVDYLIKKYSQIYQID